MTTDARRLAEAVIAEAERQGWRVVHGGRHWKLYAPDGVTIETIATTPSRAGGVEASIRPDAAGGLRLERALMGTYAVELTAGPLAEGVDVGAVAGRLCDELNDRAELDAAVGARLDSRTIGLTASVEADGVEEALHQVVAHFAEVCVTAAGAPLPILRAEVSFPSPPAASSAA